MNDIEMGLEVLRRCILARLVDQTGEIWKVQVVPDMPKKPIILLIEVCNPKYGEFWGWADKQVDWSELRELERIDELAKELAEWVEIRNSH